ncbi:MAG: cysteine desulfurase [Bacteroidaceae bacterium]|nr:cysteine desulfurase [Bacteroidaceae bacterium]
MTGLNLHSFNHENDALLEQMKNVVERYCPEELKEERRALISDEELHLESLFQGFDQLLSDGAIPSEALFPPASKAEVDRRQSDIIVPNELGNGFGVGIPETDKLRDFNYDETDTLNEDQIRRDFPILSQRVNGHPLVWLDNGATTQKPQTVIDEIGRYYSTYNSNIHRGAHTLAARATDAYEAAREKVRRFIHAPSSKNILFVRGTTEGINLIAQTFGRQYLTPGDNVIVSTLDHHANIVPWQQVARERGAELRAIPVDANGDLILSELERLISPRTRIVSVGHVNNTFGTINDVERIIEIAHSHHIPVLIDGAQSIAHTPIDIQQIGADFFVFSGHKIYGPNGIGAVYGKEEWLQKLQPWQGGGNMIKDVTLERTIYNDPPARFEAGTPNVADAIGLGAALDYVSRIGLRNIAHHEHRLTEYAREQLALVPGLTLVGHPKRRVSVVSFVLRDIDIVETGRLLDQEGIAVRAGHHCAQPALRALGYEGTVRPTFALYNTQDDVDRLVIALRKIVGQR